MLKTRLAASAAVIALCLATSAHAQTGPATPPAPGTQERVWSAAADKVGAFTTRAWAARGAGVTIAVIDSGVRADHIEFGGALVGGYDVYTGRTGLAYVADTLGHGTHVASLAAGRSDGRGMVGVASLANILPVKVFQGSSASDTIIANGIRYATSQRAFVMNLSLGGSQSTAIKSALQNAVTAGQVAVIAAGNEGAANPSWPARHASESWANGQIIAVGAVDLNNQIASFSNRAGDAKNFYLVAPGVNDIGAYYTSPTTYAYMSGTSMAAPVVAGAVAVVKSAWPYLSAKDVATVLFVTATDLGAPGVDAVYGRGLVNLERAMLPVGPVTAVGATGSKPLALAPATTTSPVTIGAKSLASANGLLDGAVFDSFGRDFGYRFGAAEISARADSLQLLSDAVDRRLSTTRVATPGGGMWLAGMAESGDSPDLDQASLGFMARDGSGWAVTMGAASPLLDMPAAPLQGIEPTAVGFASTHALFDRTANSAAVRAAFGGGDTLTLGVTQQDNARLAETSIAPQREVVAVTSLDLVAQHVTSLGAWSGGVSLLTEEGARLGDPRSSVFAVAGNAQTVLANLGMATALTPTLTFSAQATYARTAGQAGLQDGFVTHVGDTTSLAYSASLASEGVLAAGDRLDLTIGQPLTSASGAMDLALATGADPLTGAPVISRRAISLATRTPETRVELGYARHVGPASLAFLAMSRFDADGVAGREAHAALMRAAFTY